MCRAACLQEPPANTQLYSLCDMAVDTIQGLAAAMKLQLSELPHYAGGVTLPSGLYRVLNKADRGEREDSCGAGADSSGLTKQPHPSSSPETCSCKHRCMVLCQTAPLN